MTGREGTLLSYQKRVIELFRLEKILNINKSNSTANPIKITNGVTKRPSPDALSSANGDGDS